jgi:uncharacterized protein Yka (UPF0111/DUF47 family)
MKSPSFTTWMAWFGCTVAACLSLTAGAFMTFQTKDEAKDNKSDIVQRLDRIENKIDSMKKIRSW